jgi:hypothetical protein
LRDPAQNRFPQVFAANEFAPSDTDWRAYFRELDAENEQALAVGAVR